MRPLRAAAIIALLSTAALAGCNTVQGFGEDMRQGGIALSDAANQTREDMSAPQPSDAQGPRISMDRARSLALAARAGETADGELVRDPDGGQRYAFTVRTNDAAYAVGIDAQTGAVLENRQLDAE